MFKSFTNNIKSITLLIKEKDLLIVKSILNFLIEKYPRFSVIKFKTGKIGEDIIVSFKVSNEFYSKVLEKFAYNNISIIMKDKASLEYIDEKKAEKRKKLRVQGWSEISVNKRQISFSELYKLSNEGKIKGVLNEAKGGVGSNIEIIKKARDLLTDTINIAIRNIINYAEEKPNKRQEAIDQLLKIAVDKDLKLFLKFEEMNEASLAAIQISLSHESYYTNLIKIANDSKLKAATNVKAALALAKIIFADLENEFKNFLDVIKSLNTRWLRIAFETIEHNLTDSEKEIMNTLIVYVEEKRKAA